MPNPSRLAVLAAAALLSSCASISGRFVCPSQGGPAWHELRSEHAVLLTDLPDTDAEALLRDVETMRALVVAAMFRQPPPLADRFRVVAFRTDRELWELTGEHRGFGTYNTAAVLLGAHSVEPLAVVLPPERKDRAQYLGWLAYEIAAQVSVAVFPQQPRWFRTGLAVFMKPLGDLDAEGRGRVGAPPPDLVAWPSSDTPTVTLAGLLDGTAPTISYEGDTVTWLLVRWLSERQAQGFAEFQQRLARDEDGLAAWKATFPQWDPANPEAMGRLAAELAAFRAENRFSYRLVSAKVTPTIARRRLAPAEVHAIRLRVRRDPTSQEARAEVAEALAEDPLDAVALRHAAGGDLGKVAVEARAATAARPTDWRAWLLLGDALGRADDAAAAAAYRKAAETGAGEAGALLGAAAGLARVGAGAEALQPASEAARLAPWAPEAWLQVAAGAAEAAACPVALRAALRALAVAPVGARPALEKELGPVRARCATASR